MFLLISLEVLVSLVHFVCLEYRGGATSLGLWSAWCAEGGGVKDTRYEVEGCQRRL